MSRVSGWCILVAISLFGLGCGEGFQAKIRPAATFTTHSGTVTGPGIVSSPRSNLLDNADFEAGLASWEDWGNRALLTGGAHAGSRAIRINGMGGRGQEVIYRLKTGATYELKAYARVASTTDSVYVGVKYFDTGNGQLGDERVRVNTTAYSEYSVRFKVPIQVSSAKIYMYKENTSGGTADFDDFSLMMVEAPVNPPMLPAVANPGNVQPAGPAPGWTLVFADEFTGNILNSSVWNTGFWFNYTINNELQAYRPENVVVQNGVLNLTAEKRSTMTLWGEPMNYASGAVTTRGKFTFTFGVAEARIKVPKGRGYFPAFWLLPNNKRSPPEIDVMQVLGHDPGTARFNYMWIR